MRWLLIFVWFGYYVVYIRPHSLYVLLREIQTHLSIILGWYMALRCVCFGDWYLWYSHSHLCFPDSRKSWCVCCYCWVTVVVDNDHCVDYHFYTFSKFEVFHNWLALYGRILLIFLFTIQIYNNTSFKSYVLVDSDFLNEKSLRLCELRSITIFYEIAIKDI